MPVFVRDGRDLVINVDTAPLDKTLLNHPLECEAVGVTLDTTDRYPGHGWARFSKQERREWYRIYPKGDITKRKEQHSDISPIRQLYHDAFDLILSMEIMRLVIVLCTRKLS